MMRNNTFRSIKKKHRYKSIHVTVLYTIINWIFLCISWVRVSIAIINDYIAIQIIILLLFSWRLGLQFIFSIAFASPFSAHFNRHKVGKYRKSIILFNNFLMRRAEKNSGISTFRSMYVSRELITTAR